MLFSDGASDAAERRVLRLKSSAGMAVQNIGHD